MTDEVAAQHVSPSDWLRKAEDRYKPLIAGVSLVVEADFTAQDVTTALKAIGFEYRRIDRNWEDPSRLWSTYPATMLVAVAGTGTLFRSQGSYWPEFFIATGMTNNPAHRGFFGEGFIATLKQFGLPTFPDLPLRFLGPILMHAGIPNGSLGDLIDLIGRRRQLDPGLTATSFLAWGLAPGVESRLQPAGKPAQHFLGNGDEFALDVVERLLDAIDYLAENPAASATGLLTSDTTGLPTVMIEKLCQLVRDDDVDLLPVARAAAGARTRDETPTLRLDHFNSAVAAMLPSTAAASGSVTWTIFADGGRWTVESNAGWVGGNQKTQRAEFRLPGPKRRIQVMNSASDVETNLTLVDPDDPLLLFDDGGEFIPAQIPVPKGVVWALWPNSHALGDGTDSDAPLIFEDTELPGWPKWRIAQVDTSNLSSLRLSHDGSVGRVRRVRRDTLPVVDLRDLQPSLYAPDGQPVYSQRPLIALPNDPAGTTKWAISVTRVGSADALVDLPGLLAPDEGPLDVFKELDEPLLGRYTIRIRGPLGRRVTRALWLAEGLSVDTTPAIRMIRGPGLQPAAAAVRSSTGMELAQSQIDFDSQTVEMPISVKSPSGVYESFAVKPPHMAILVDAPGAAAKWSPAMARLTTDQVAEGGTLQVRLPGDPSSIELEFIHEDGRQRIRADGRRSGDLYRFNLGKFTDTVQSAGRGRLILVADEQQIPIGTIRPPAYASAATDQGDHIELVDYIHAPHVKAALYSFTAPWLDPRVCPVGEGGVIEIPAALRNAGNLAILLAEDDPWVGTDWPRWPESGALLCDRIGFYESSDPGEQALSLLLDEQASVKPDASELTVDRRLWISLAVLDKLQLIREHHAQVTAAFRDAVALDPDSSWFTLADTGLSPEVTCGLAIKSHLTDLQTRPDTDPEKIGELWPRNPDIAALLATSNLVDTRETSTNDLEELRKDSSMYIGEMARQILAKCPDPYRETAQFGPVAAQLAEWPKARVEAIWRAAQFVPEGLLEKDSRATAARELFDRRSEKRIGPLLKELGNQLQWAKRVLNKYANSAIKNQLSARMETGPSPKLWQFLPALSFAFAAAARMHAWYPDAIRPMTSASRDFWQTLAAVAPKLTRVDLVLADLLIAADHHALETEA